MSIANALRRCGVQHTFCLLTNSPSFASLADRVGVPHREVPPENETQLSPENYASSALYNAITELNPERSHSDHALVYGEQFHPGPPLQEDFSLQAGR